MTRSHASLGFVAAGIVVAALVVGCSDDNGAPGKSSAAGTGMSSAAKPADSVAATEAAKESDAAPPPPTPEPKSTAQEAVKPDAKPDAKPAVKAEPRPPEGKVDVKAEPDPPSADDLRPHGTGRRYIPTSIPESDENPAPKFSAFAAADDLAAELKILIADLEKAVVSKEEFDSQVEGRFMRDGNTIALIAIALGLHDQDNSVKPNAKAIAAAAQKLAQAKDFAATAQAVEDLKAAANGKRAGGGELKSAKVGTLNGLMKDEMTGINTKLKTGLRHFKQRADAVAANAATMALIGENAKLYLADTKKPGEGQKWNDFTDQFQAAAVDIAVKAHAGDEAGAKVSTDKLNTSCENCHAVFNPEKK